MNIITNIKESYKHIPYSWKHHLRKYKKHMHFEEAILDWESARFTKPDKPMDAWETYQKLYTDFSDDLLPIFERFNLKH